MLCNAADVDIATVATKSYVWRRHCMLKVLKMAEKEITSGIDQGVEILTSGKTKKFLDTLQVVKLT